MFHLSPIQIWDEESKSDERYKKCGFKSAISAIHTRMPKFNKNKIFFPLQNEPKTIPMGKIERWFRIFGQFCYTTPLFINIDKELFGNLRKSSITTFDLTWDDNECLEGAERIVKKGQKTVEIHKIKDQS
jgi:hypothetical protein